MINGEMTWKFLAEGGYLQPLFTSWYTSIGQPLYTFSWIFHFFFFPCLAGAKSLLLQDPSKHPRLRKLLRWPNENGNTKARGLKRQEIILSSIILILSILYGWFFRQIVIDPDGQLTTEGLQWLSAEDFDRAIRFLHLFSALGFFFVVVNLFAALRMVAYFFTAPGGSRQ